MIPSDLAATVQLYLDRYVTGTLVEQNDPTVPIVGPGIRRRFPAVLGIPPEYDPLPNGMDQMDPQIPPFKNGQGPEAFSDPLARYLDRCPLERAQVTTTADGVSIDFIFVVRYRAGQFDPSITEPVVLPSGDELLAIMSECLSKVQEFMGTDDTLGGTANDFNPSLSSTFQVLTRDEFDELRLPDVQVF
jgi:hypothetical protein